MEATTPELRSKRGNSHCGLIITTFKHLRLFKIMIERGRCRGVIRKGRRGMFVVAVVFADLTLASGRLRITVTAVFVQLNGPEVDTVFNVGLVLVVVLLFVVRVLIGNARQARTLDERRTRQRKCEHHPCQLRLPSRTSRWIPSVSSVAAPRVPRSHW